MRQEYRYTVRELGPRVSTILEGEDQNLVSSYYLDTVSSFNPDESRLDVVVRDTAGNLLEKFQDIQDYAVRGVEQGKSKVHQLEVDPTIFIKNIDVVSQTLYFSFIQTLITLSAKYLTEQRAFPRSVIVISFIFLIVYVFAWEMLCSVISHRLYDNGELVIIGANQATMQAVSDKIQPSLPGLDLNLSEPIKYSDKRLVSAAIRRNAEIFICPDVPEDVKSDIILSCAKYKAVAYVVPQFYEISLYRSRLISLNDLMVFMLD